MRALVLSGGASLSGFQAGVLKALTVHKGRRYDLIVGTSGGALNGAYFAQVPLILQAQRAHELTAFWLSAKPGDFYKKSFFAPFFQGGFYDTSPMRKTIDRHAKKTTAVPFICTAVNADTGELVTARSGDVDDIRPWIHASASVPVVFPPVSIDGEDYMDGGVRMNVPVEIAVAEGATEIDVVVCHPRKMVPGHFDETGPSIPKAALVAFYSLVEQAIEGNVERWEKNDHLSVNVYAPDELPKTRSPLSFTRYDVEQMLAHGELVGRRPDPA